MKGIFKVMLILAVAGGVCLWMSAADFINMSKEPVNIYLVDYCGYTTSEATEMLCPYMIARGNIGASRVLFFVGLFLVGGFWYACSSY